MICQTPFSVNLDVIDAALQRITDAEGFTINKPSGNFFYDPWILKDEYNGTVWEDIYNSLPVQDKGEARIIKLAGSESYSSHADIDDRYHLNLSGLKSFLIDLDNLEMYHIVKDGIWYDMNAGQAHTACNFGNRPRYQLVIRKLLTKGNLKDPVTVKLVTTKGVYPEDARFIFDDVVSKWLNQINKKNQLDNFMFKDGVVTFTIDNSLTEELKSILPKEFIIE